MSDNPLRQAMRKECIRQHEACLYNVATLAIWLRFLKGLNTIFVVAPLVLGSLAAWKLLDQDQLRVWTAVFAFLAGLFPAMHKALRLDASISTAARSTATYKSLRDNFRHLAEVAPHQPHELSDKIFLQLRKQQDELRGGEATPPEWCFLFAQYKVRKGHYRFDGDEENCLPGTEVDRS